jgi:His/Glu/Gln/Arg/opine family amino acid ABC transporter permease subunit
VFGAKLATWFSILFFATGLSFSFAAESPIRVGLTGKYPPFNTFDTKGKLVGFDVDIARSLCRRLERPCDFKILPWDGILAALLTEKIDVIIGSMAITPEREKQANFTDPYYESGAQLFVREMETQPEREGFRIGVTLGTTYGEFAKKRFPKAEIRTYKGDTEVFQDIESVRLDAMITDRLVGAYMNKVRKAGLKLKGPLLFRERMGIPVKLSASAFHDQLNKALNDLLIDPEYLKIHAKYFGEDALPTPTKSGAEIAGTPWFDALRLMGKAWVSTLVLSIEGLFLGCLLSLGLAVLLIYPPTGIRSITLIYVDFVRSTPFMIQLFAIYFGLPAIGIRLPAWQSGVFAIALHLSAYLSETIKVAYQSIQPGQHQAAQVLGLGKLKALRYVIFPQMIPILLAPTLNTLVAMIKDSAIISVISVHELTMQTQQLISTTFRPLEFYGISAVLYALITYPLLILGRKMEKHYRSKGLLHGRA